jgi:ABC-type multidrug transport system ATPase subunit
MDNGDLVVETRGLTKRYGSGILAVDNLDLVVRKAEVYGFLGPNGAGKTTTLRMLMGLISPTAGVATVAGHPPGSPEGLGRIGALVENPAFYPYLSGRDNLSVIARYSGVPRAHIDDALNEVGLLARGNHKYATYSFGMKQRLGVAAALIKEPELLILDEPTNGLDPQGMLDMRDLIRDLGNAERTVLLSSHLMNEVQQLCDRIGVIQSGRLIAQGTVDEIRGGVELLVRASPLEQAQAVLEQLLGPDAVRVQDGVLLLRVDADRTTEISRLLITSGCELSELRPSERSLEDVFLQLTGEESGA